MDIPPTQTNTLQFANTKINYIYFFKKFSLPIILLILITSIVGFYMYTQYFSKKARLGRELQSIITLVQNPDPAIVAQYRFPQGRIESNQRMILSGALDKNVPGLTFILEDTIRTKRDLPLAKKQLEKIFKNAILDHTVLPDDSDRVILPEEQKPLYDPTGVYFTKGAFDTFSAINKDAGLKIILLLYKL